MLVACWVLLGLEECVKVPEGALNVVVSRHLGEPGGRRSLTALPVPRLWPPGSLPATAPGLGSPAQPLPAPWPRAVYFQTIGTE